MKALLRAVALFPQPFRGDREMFSFVSGLLPILRPRLLPPAVVGGPQSLASTYATLVRSGYVTAVTGRVATGKTFLCQNLAASSILIGTTLATAPSVLVFASSSNYEGVYPPPRTFPCLWLVLWRQQTNNYCLLCIWVQHTTTSPPILPSKHLSVRCSKWFTPCP